MIAAQLAYVAMVFTDTVMMGKLGPDALAAGGLGAVSYAFVSTFCVGVVAAVGNLVAIRHGCDDAAGAAAAARSGLWVGAALALAAGLLLWNLRPLLLLFGQAPQTVDGAMQFLHSLTFALPGYMAFMVLRGFTSAIDRAGPVMAISVLGALANLALNYSFIEGLFGLPRLGLAGIGLVTALVMNCMPLLLALYIRRQPAYAAYSLLRGLGRPQRAMVEEILRLGLPIGGTYAVESGMFTVATLCMGIIGDHALAAHQIAIQAVYVAFMVPVGLSYATTYRIGQHFGAGRLLEARRAGRVGIGFGALCMLLFAGLFWWMPEAIIGLFLDRDAPANGRWPRWPSRCWRSPPGSSCSTAPRTSPWARSAVSRTPAPPSWSAWPATGWSACRWPACWRSRPAGAPRASGGGWPAAWPARPSA